MEEKFYKPFLLKNGKTTVFKGTRSDCISRMAREEGDDLRIVENGYHANIYNVKNEGGK